MNEPTTGARTTSEKPAPRICPICASQTRAVFDFLVQRQYRIVTSPSDQEAFGASRGFCAFHMWLLKQIGDPLSLSKALAPVVEAWADDIRHRLDGPVERAIGAIAAALPSPAACPVCAVQRETGVAHVQYTAAALETQEGRERFAHGPGLCLHHLVAVLRARLTPEQARFLLGEHARRLQEVAADLHGYAAKRDALHRELITDDEHGAWRWALALLAGERPLRELGPDHDGEPEE